MWEGVEEEMVFVIKSEVESLEVFEDVLRFGGFGDGDDVFLSDPVEDDLGGRAAVFFGEF